ncbi:uncharacterized protein CANTADRAFT_25499 [Suhomyces tanzawaensis NRRL Y-17324]|uniref:Uncharacterized protein n=1 Tax=Suhomyces tanzawaensis NRRL Y-17324 TaxID=984487 RepID=A0A1E4SP62_9ASCO|nr:uncharacterized protein CANTADRAFT_25499 [Suhomyces tanzawaensis NRRL Y-17324]ODV81314.1 hypothetical protein CANTADRAFT_25499 [Suhomyces tanzawaensis NRRL Y-17324]
MKSRSLFLHYKQAVISVISFVLSHPRTVILVPTICVFVLSYNVAYDFTIKRINSHLPISIDQHTLFQELELFPAIDSADTLKDVVAGDFSKSPFLQCLTKVSLSEASNGSASDNILSFDFFRQLHKLQHMLVDSYNDSVVIISPLSDWPMNRVRFGDPEISPSIFNIYLIKYLNYDLNNLLTFLYVDRIVKSNHLIKYAKNIHVYLIHNHRVDVAGAIGAFLSSTSSLLQVDEILSTSKQSSIRDFIHYYLYQKKRNFYANLFITSSNFAIFTSIIAFIIFIYISIANEHKIRSSFGLVLGWLVGVFISSAAAVNLTVLFHGYKSWRLIFEPLTAFTKASLLITILIMSSRGLFITISTLSKSESNLADFHRRLYKFYTGFNGFPLIIPSYLFNIGGVSGVYGIGTLILYYNTEGNLYNYFKLRCSKVLEVFFIALTLQALLQLSYIVGIIMIDLKRVDYTTILNNQNIKKLSSDDNLVNANDGVNFFSSFLLQLNKPLHLRPSRTSSPTRYSLGQFFLKVRYSIRSETCSCVMVGISLVVLLGVFIHWSLIIPSNLMNDNHRIVDLGGLNILSNTNNFIYYLEFLSILIFIVASSFIVFRLTGAVTQSANQIMGLKSSIFLVESDFETEKKYLNMIELPGVLREAEIFQRECTGHSLDIIKVKTNSRSSFVVSVGLDHKVLIWSPLSQPVPKPVNIATTVQVNGVEREFWPINHVNISDGGNFIVLMNYKYGIVKCYERKDLNYKWETSLPDDLKELIKNKNFKIVESFFRKRTVPGFLARKIIQKQRELQPIDNDSVAGTPNLSRSARRNSNVSLSSMNGNFPLPLSHGYHKDAETERRLSRDDFIAVLETGYLLTFSCVDGKMKMLDILSLVYPDHTGLHLVSVKKVRTPRINDRIVCQVSNYDIIIGTSINNGWKFKKLQVKEGFYNQEGQKMISGMMSQTNSFGSDNNFTSVYMNNSASKLQNELASKSLSAPPRPLIQVNKPIIAPVEFVGMIVRVKNFTAELIDIQRGYVLKTFNVGHFKPSTFKVAHLEPTHCKFCGCASIQSFSIVYEDYDQPTLIIHTFRIDIKRSKNNICLRVERDPREIRCLGFGAATEHQYWFNNMEGWELTDVNMIIGFRKKGSLNDDNYHAEEDEFEPVITAPKIHSFDSMVENSGLMSLRQRRKPKSSQTKIVPEDGLEEMWDGFIITVFDGKEISYRVPSTENHRIDFLSDRINSVEKYGYKSALMCTSNMMEIFYLGNENLIEDDIYFSGTNATIWSVLEDQTKKNNSNKESDAFKLMQPFNSELLFINKRRKMSERIKGSRVQRLQEGV